MVKYEYLSYVKVGVIEDINDVGCLHSDIIRRMVHLKDLATLKTEVRLPYFPKSHTLSDYHNVDGVISSLLKYSSNFEGYVRYERGILQVKSVNFDIYMKEKESSEPAISINIDFTQDEPVVEMSSLKAVSSTESKIKVWSTLEDLIQNTPFIVEKKINKKPV